MLRRVCILLLIWGAVTAAYTGWSLHRVSNGVMMVENGWPRAAPYPDEWLLALNDWFEKRHPAPTGVIKLHSELPRVRMTLLRALAISAGVTLGGGIVLAWPWLRRVGGRRGFEMVGARSTLP